MATVRASFIGSGACLGLVALLALSGCAKIAGIDDPPEKPSTGDADVCNTYCDSVMVACDEGHSVYASREACMGVCNNLVRAGKAGSATDQSGDTVYCRLFYAQQVRATGETEGCQYAGPGGGGVCGSNCEAYCVLMQQICPTQFTSILGGNVQVCLEQCAGLPEVDAGFSIALQMGNSIDCRLYHVSAAAVNSDTPAIHCPHAGGETPCK